MPHCDREQKESVIKQFSDGLKKKTATHPCFTAQAHEYARLHLAVAPKCNIQCNYCNRKFSCANESRPGVTSGVLTPTEALQRFVEVKRKVPNLSVVGISGPGDPLANIEDVLETVRLVRENDENMTFCLSTNGLALEQYAHALYKAGVTHFTVTMNAIDPVIGAKIYKYINGEGTIYTGARGSAFLIERQLAGLAVLMELDVMTKVNIVAIKGVNDAHIEEVVFCAKEYKVSTTNITPLIPVAGTPFAHHREWDRCELNDIRDNCAKHIPQLYHCRQCRADAIGLLNKDISQELFADKICHYTKLRSNG